MKHCINIFLILIKFIFLDLLVRISSIFVVPFALLFCNKDSTHLPKIFRMYETYNYDINGDPPWQGIEHANGKQNTYWWRLKWLFRNPIGTWTYKVLGCNIFPDTKYYVEGDIMTSNIAPNHPGFLYARATNPDGKTYHSYYYVLPWSSTKCLRIYLGYKFRKAMPINEWAVSEPTRYQFTVQANPFADFHP